MSTKVEIRYSELVKQAVINSFKKLNPRDEIKNLVMFVVWVGSIWTTVILFTPGGCNLFNVQICFWLWFTCLFANFAEAMAEAGGRPMPTHCASCAPRRWPANSSRARKPPCPAPS